MPVVCLCFEVHQPRRLRRYAIFDVDRVHDYEDREANLEILNRVADRCYLRCETPDAEDMDISWRQAQDDMLSHGERERLYSDVISHNRQVVIHPS